MLDNISYNQTFQNEVITNNCRKSPIHDLIKCRYKAIDFTTKVFKLYPELFSEKASSLYYIELAGTTKKAELIYNLFEDFITSSPNNVIEAIINGTSLVGLDCDPIIGWARFIQQTKKCYIFEPVLTLNNKVLQSFLNKKQLNYRQKIITLNDLRPVSYTNVGENIIGLLPYITYIYNFFINCRNYTFNEIISGSKQNVFMENVNNTFDNYYIKLLSSIQNTQTITISQLYSNPEYLVKLFDQNVLRNMFSEMLSYELINKIRDKVIEMDTSNELQQCVNIQLSVSEEVVEKGYYQVLSNLIDIILDKNPITKEFLKIPYFDMKNIDVFELEMMTHYAISGGKCPFGITKTNEYVGSADKYSEIPGIPKQQLLTEVFPITIGPRRPFVESNVALNIATAYVRDKFEEIQTDLLSDSFISIDETFIDTEKIGKDRMENILVGLFVNGKWLHDNGSMANIFKILMNSKTFRFEIEGILNLSKIYELFFTNKFAAKMLPAYILSFLNEWILSFILNDRCGNLNNFYPMVYFCLNHKFDIERIRKLSNMQTSIMFLHNKAYTNLVNEKVREISKLLTFNSYIFLPYLKGISDKIDVYGIGGCELVNKAKYANPLVRGYWYLVSTQGTCENVETVYEWIKFMDSSTAYSLIEDAINANDQNTIIKILINRFNNMIDNNNVPLLLNNYEFIENGTFRLKTTPYYIDLTSENNSNIVSLLTKFAFPMSHAKNIQSKELYFKPVNYRNGSFKATVSNKNKLKFGDNSMPAVLKDITQEYKVPYYDYNSSMESANIAFTPLSGYKLYVVITDNGRTRENNVFWIFSKLTTVSFDRHFNSEFNNIYDQQDSSYYKNRMGILGLTKKPVPNIS